MSRCKEWVFASGSIMGRNCNREAARDGYCIQHHPDTVAARRAEASRRWEEKHNNSPLTIAGRKIEELNATIAGLKGYIDQLEAKLIAPEPKSGWQPIETAPRDGNPILIASRHGAYSIAVMLPHGGPMLWSDKHADYAAPCGPWPTHWQPLPEAPDA